jgi:hypothetical protein
MGGIGEGVVFVEGGGRCRRIRLAEKKGLGERGEGRAGVFFPADLGDGSGGLKVAIEVERFGKPKKEGKIVVRDYFFSAGSKAFSVFPIGEEIERDSCETQKDDNGCGCDDVNFYGTRR